jgi:hypothetical protein
LDHQSSIAAQQIQPASRGSRPLAATRALTTMTASSTRT